MFRIVETARTIALVNIVYKNTKFFRNFHLIQELEELKLSLDSENEDFEDNFSILGKHTPI